MTSPPPSEDAVQLQNAMQHIDALHHQLGQAMSGLESLVSAHAQPPHEGAAAHGAGPLQDTVSQLHDLSTQLGAALTQSLAHAVEELRQSTAQTQSGTQQHAQDWDHTHDTLKSSLAALEQAATQTASAAVATFGELQTSVEHVTQTTQDLLHQFEQAAQTLQHGLADTVTSALSRASQEFHDGVTGALNAKITEHLTECFQHGEQALANVAHTAEHVAQQFAHEAEDALHHFAQGVSDGVKHEIEQVAEHLGKDVLELVSTFVATSIAEATAGAAITGAMSPILPEVIVVKEASEVIKDLISVFKAVGSLL
ncbi:MAG TPA: hypothetical protein VGC96_04320 [Candidatus Elarobacter sp.]|jgi:hypothetical protein